MVMIVTGLVRNLHWKKDQEKNVLMPRMMIWTQWTQALTQMLHGVAGNVHNNMTLCETKAYYAIRVWSDSFLIL